MDKISTDHALDAECRSIAAEIVAEHEPGGRDDAAHEYVDGHEAVIYHYRAHAICQGCDVSQGEEFLDDMGGAGAVENVSYDKLATLIAYGEMVARVRAFIAEIEAEQEESDDAA